MTYPVDNARYNAYTVDNARNTLFDKALDRELDLTVFLADKADKLISWFRKL
jgi:hypothetical protein